jgi:siroheme synthase-like protein
MGYFPVFLDLGGRPCLVVGGGAVAERKATVLLAAGARVTVISPALTEELASLARDGRIRHVARTYRDGDLAGYQLALVATDQPDVSAAVAAEGRARGAWVNAADDAAHSDFILPSTLRRGELVVAVGTGGTSPALARSVREELERYFTEDYTTLARVAADVRREVRRREPAPGAEAWRRALDAEVRRLVAEDRAEDAQNLLRERLAQAGGEP